MEITDETIDLLFGALAEQLQALGCHLEIVVIGGSALTALGLVGRATRCSGRVKACICTGQDVV
jgi:hypothetical protein